MIPSATLPGHYPDGEKERRQIYCHLVLSLLQHYWNPFKKGGSGTYHWLGRKPPESRQYLGHNIACIAVDDSGRIIDFDFNHNELFNSSIEHAEARLLRRLYTMTSQFHPSPLYVSHLFEQDKGLATQIFKSFAKILEHMDKSFKETNSHYSKALNKISIYTSLESCAQCSGMMALGSLKEVIYIQADPGQKNIGRLLFDLNGPGSAFKAPKPIAASDFGLTESGELERSYSHFVEEVGQRPFHTKGNKEDRSSSITSFLCTDDAFAIFGNGLKKLLQTHLLEPTWRPPGKPSALSNAEVLEQARLFYRLAIVYGRRGTPQTR